MKVGDLVRFASFEGWYEILKIPSKDEILIKHLEGVSPFIVNVSSVEQLRPYVAVIEGDCSPTPKETTMQIFTIKVIRNATEKRQAKILGTFEDILAPNKEIARREVLVSDRFKKMLGKLSVSEVSLPAESFPISE